MNLRKSGRILQMKLLESQKNYNAQNRLTGRLINKQSLTSIIHNFKWLVFIILLIAVNLLGISFYNQKPLWFRSIQPIVAGIVGLNAVVLSLYLSSVLWNEQERLAKGILIGALIATTQFFGYFVQYPTSVFASHHPGRQLLNKLATSPYLKLFHLR